MSAPIGKPSIEDLSEVAWSRVEHAVFARLDADPAVAPATRHRIERRWWIPMSLAAAVVAAAALVVLVRAPQRPEVPTEWSRVVSSDSPSRVSLGDVDVELDARSAVVLQHGSEQQAVVLEHGAAWFSVAPRGSRPPFAVVAGDTMVRVVGTRFRVARDGERTDVAVDHGLVEVRFRGRLARVAAGETWSSSAPDVVTLPTTAPPPSAPASPVAPPPSAPASPVAPPPVAPAPPSHVLPPAVPPSATHLAADPDQQRFEALAKLEATRPARAIDGYLVLARGSGPWAALALYSAGRLAADRHEPRAATLLAMYLTRFPAGANAADVQYLLDRLQGAPR